MKKKETPARATGRRNEKTFLEWLTSEVSSSQELLEWCYYGFGAGRDTAEPHAQMLQALPLGGDSFPARERLAARMAAVLLEAPTLKISGFNEPSEQEHVLYNLFALAATLDCGAILHGPLDGVYHALHRARRVQPVIVRAALLAAMVGNQIYSTTTRAIWLKMAMGKKDSVLGGTAELGFEGLAMMPGETPGQPDREGIGQGLLHLAKLYSGDKQQRRQKFRAQAVWVKQLWDMTPEMLIQIADKYGWAKEGHPWAIDALCEFFAADFGSVGPDEQQACLVWHWFARCLEPWGGMTVVGEYCGGTVKLVRFDREAAAEFKKVHKAVVRHAVAHPDCSEHEALCHVHELISSVVKYAHDRAKPAVAQRLNITLREFIGRTKVCLV